jgi:hypothetical protein
MNVFPKAVKETMSESASSLVNCQIRSEAHTILFAPRSEGYPLLVPGQLPNGTYPRKAFGTRW